MHGKRKKIQNYYSLLEKTNLPSFSGIDTLDDWIEDLIELDACLAGLASSAANGIDILKREIPDIQPLKNRFEQIRLLCPDAQDKLDDCRSYIELLQSIREELLFIAGN